MSSWNSYPKIYNFGHPTTKQLIGVNCRVEEKVDGSQFSFGAFWEPRLEDSSLMELVLKCRSRKREIQLEAPDDLFCFAVATAQELFAKGQLTPGWTYRGEAFKAPRHNTLTYGRVPGKHIAIFDIAIGENDYLNRASLELECTSLGLEPVRVYERATAIASPDDLKELLKAESALGKAKIEGVVLKPLKPIFAPDGKPIFAKVVSEDFRELHVKNPDLNVPRKGDVIDQIAVAVSTVPRWRKTVERLRDAGELEGSPSDIGQLIRELQQDIVDECEPYIKDVLFNTYRKKILGTSVRGFPEWYKNQLVEDLFDEAE